jgi:hypothetical protein
MTAPLLDTSKDQFSEADSTLILHQLGRALFNISGGRAVTTPTGVVLPVSQGYKVTIDLDADDTYTVRRILSRNHGSEFRTWLKGEVTSVYPDVLAEIAIQAGSWESNEFPKER